MNLILRI